MAIATGLLLVVAVNSGVLAPTSVPGGEAVDIDVKWSTPNPDLPDVQFNASDAAPEFKSHQTPWGGRNVTIAIVTEIQPGPGNPNLEWALKDATGWWEEHDEMYAGYEIDYVIIDEPAEADVLVVVKSDVVCEGDRVAVGCAPLIDKSDVVTEQTVVRVEMQPGPDFVRSLAHELGHTLGITHENMPRELR